MLKQRILTISILLPLFVWLLWFSSNTVFLWVTAGVISLAAFEWLKLLKLNNLMFGLLFVVFLGIIGFFIFNDYINCYNNYLTNKSKIEFGIFIFIFWSFIFSVGVLLYRETLAFHLEHSAAVSVDKLRNKLPIAKFIFILTHFQCLWGVLIPSWLAMNHLKIHNKNLLVFACSIIIAADIGAYISGKLFGKHKLTIISPGKTWEGVLGGYIGTLLVASVYIILNINSVAFNYNEYYYYYFNNDFNYSNPIFDILANSNYIFILKIFLITTVTFIFSVIGDLCESLLKRIAGVKDSGNILPGHGGILDRIDSFCSGIPMFLLSFLLLNKYLE